MTQAPEKPVSLQRHMARGSAWSVSVRWAARALGFVSTIILARLLMPADFGIVTIAMIVVGGVEIFNQTGQHLAIIRHPDPTREHYDSAWTIFIILGTVLAAIIFLASPLTEIYFHEPRAVLVVRFLALKTFISGFENVGVVNFQRDLQFHKQFLYRFLPSFISFFVTLGAAFWFHSYWALVTGILTQEFAALVLSYTLSSYRPRLSLAKVGELWSFSIWTLVRNIGGYIGNQIDKLAIGGFAGAAAMGRYEVAVDVSSAPSLEIINPMLSVLFPVMASAKGDAAKLRDLYLTVLYWSVLICSSTAIGVALVASDMVDAVLGPQWEGVKPLVPLLALAYGVSGPGYSVFTVLDVANKPRVSARIQWTAITCMSICLVATAVTFHSLVAVAMARLAVAVVLLPVFLWVAAGELALAPRDFSRVFWRPALASAVMAAAVLAVESMLGPGPLRLLASVPAGALAYGGSILVIWHAIGCPDGPEKTVWHILRRLGARQRGQAGAGQGTGQRRRHGAQRLGPLSGPSPPRIAGSRLLAGVIHPG